MTAIPIDGKGIAARIQQTLKGEVAFFTERHFKPCLAMILVGNDPASRTYVRKKQEACANVGIESKIVTDIVSHMDLMEELEIRAADKKTHGILVQLPLPKDEWSEDDLFEVFSTIHPLKDVDVFNPQNVGLLVQGRPRFIPCTPHGIQRMLKYAGISVKGKHVVVINRSNIVGKPLSSLLIQDNDEFANATVTVCHDNTPMEQLSSIARTADIVVVAVGIPNFLKPDMVKSGQIIIDVGTTRIDNKIVGDVSPEVWEIASMVTPVPGGCGPMTVAMLMYNTLQAARYQIGVI